MDNFPVDFQELAQRGGNSASGGYPYQIKATDLMRNFVFAALDADPTLLEEKTGQGGYTQRRLKIPPAPQGGTHVLGCNGGILEWLETEECS